MNTIQKTPVKRNIDYLENLGFIILTKLELNDIIRNAKLGKVPVVHPKGRIIGWRE